MKTILIKITILILFSTLIGISHCLSQNIRPKNKIKIDSLYPNARIIGGNGANGKTQDVIMYCNCPEFAGEMQLIFDTNAHILEKVYYFNSLKPLPDAILNYIKTNVSQTVKIESSDVRKNINYKGEISYTIFMNESGTEYSIELKSDGEIISKKPLIKYGG